MIAKLTLLAEAVRVGTFVGCQSSSPGESVAVLSNPLGLLFSLVLVTRESSLEVRITWQVVVLLGVLIGVVLFVVVRVEQLALLVIRLQEDRIFKVGSDVHGSLVVSKTVVATGARLIRTTIVLASKRHTTVLLLGLARFLVSRNRCVCVILVVVMRLVVGELIVVWIVVSGVALGAVVVNLTLVRIDWVVFTIGICNLVGCSRVAIVVALIVVVAVEVNRLFVVLLRLRSLLG